MADKIRFYVMPFQFLESEEWIMATTDEFSKVSARALENSTIIIWHRDQLKFAIKTDPYLTNILNVIIGEDLLEKLLPEMSNTVVMNDDGPKDIETVLKKDRGGRCE